MIIVNFKTYETAVGENAVALAKIHEMVAEETGAPIAVAVNALDLAAVLKAVRIPVFVQSIDVAGFGSCTGSIVPELVKKMGAVGTLLNHSEKRLGENLAKSVAAAKAAGLQIVLCAEDDDEAAKFAAEFEPDFVAVEPPELIGGDISVTSANPAVIEDSVKKVGAIPLLVGAGVKNGEDVKTALKLGAKGVLLASGITKAENPAAVLRDLAAGLN
ncbi:triose-phosphate isomerase [Candidatus Gracilibacteria bacterium]|nr:triose-phosphate isomerase [Candidatus Gracilibacteria bacterium]MCF7856485.1 triose-phosphate isomerase [Candidatus Gracilibacteria bacterium]MCF7896781.1 triose-phosphate isomerase [Candidatus Gracilibacteria bacterium]